MLGFFVRKTHTQASQKSVKVKRVEHLTGVVGELDRVDGVHFEPQDLGKKKTHTLVEASTFSAVSAGILSQQS